MKAIELANILLMTPNAEVVHYQYIGCDTPLMSIDTCILEAEGERTQSYDGGDFINEKGRTQKEIVILVANGN